jgi:hypothetical protein
MGKPEVIIPTIWRYYSVPSMPSIYEQVTNAADVKWRSVDVHLCSSCNERYCGNCAHANGAKVQ